MMFNGGEWTLSERSPRHRPSRTTRGVVRTRGASLLLVGALASHAFTGVVTGCDGTHVLAAAIPSRMPLVFRVEGSSADPEYRRACRLVEGLEDLYGKDRYRLHQVDLEIQFPPDQQRWLPRWLSNFADLPRAIKPPRTFPPVSCSVESQDDSGSAPGEAGDLGGDGDDDAAPENHVVIGGVEELLEFVRGSVLAGPRPVSPAFHQESLRLGSSTATEPRGGNGNHKDASSLPRGSGSGDPNCRREKQYEFDLVVIGGGSGGLACAKEAARLGRKVACLDFVKPSPQGTTWGLGGTCVNVGCIPKKLMHQAALLGGHRKDATFFGWREGSAGGTGRVADGDGDEDRGRGDHDWQKMVQSVQNYIKGLNFGYRTDLRSKQVEYLNALGRLEDAHTVMATDKNGKERVLTCGAVVLAVGGRPKGLDCEGGDLAITSDDIFSSKRSPGRVLVVGASYVALECAGFLTGFGVDTTVMVRSILLRGFDQAIAERIGRFMEAEGTRFLRPAVPHRILRTAGGRLLVSWKEEGKGVLREEEFDTVLAATGRTADISGLGLRATGVELGRSGKILCTNEETTAPGVFALGDAVEGVPELTPSAIQAGRLLARRLFGGSVEAMDYRNVCTTVFTPLEYACCGMSDEDAVRLLGEDHVEVYHSAFTPLEWQLNPERPRNACYVKAVCDIQDRRRVVGLHLLGPHAGEVMQGFGLGIRLGMTYDDLRQLVGIHPTVAEELTVLEITKRSGEPIGKSAC